jgi:hypothetical protein
MIHCSGAEHAERGADDPEDKGDCRADLHHGCGRFV